MTVMMIAAVAMMALGTTAPAEETVSPFDGLPPELQVSIVTFYKSIESADVETRIGLLDDDVVMMPNHWTMSRGKETVAAGLRASAGGVFRLRDREMVAAEVAGDVAYTVNSYFYTWHAEGEEPQWHKTKNVHVWRRGSDGEWRLRLDIWNSDVPMAAFAEE